MEIVCNAVPCKSCKDIHIATKLGHIPCLDLMDDVNCRNSAGETCLHIAARFQDVEIVTFLLEQKNSNITILNKDGFSPFYIAVMKNKTEMVLYMISHIVTLGIDASKDSSEMALSFYMAGYRGNIRVLESMIHHGFSPPVFYDIAWISRVFPQKVFPFLEKYKKGHTGQLRWSRDNYQYLPYNLRKNIKHLVMSVHHSEYKKIVKPVLSVIISHLMDQYFYEIHRDHTKLPMTNLHNLYYGG